MATMTIVIMLTVLIDNCTSQSIQIIDLTSPDQNHQSHGSYEVSHTDQVTTENPITVSSSMESVTSPTEFSGLGATAHSDHIDQKNQESCGVENDAQVNSVLLDHIMPTYNKQALPNSTRSVETRVEIQINAIPHFSELDSFFELDLFFSELWHEPRLAFGNYPQSGCVKNVTLGLEYLQKLWTPNICIVNSKAALIHSSPSENVFLILYQDGTLWKNCRMLVRGPCEIDLRLFPFDVQTCSLVFESYSFNSQKVTLRWYEQSAIRLAQSIELPDFILANYVANRSIVTYPNGHWDQLKATFVFERRYGFFIMQVYLPTYMTVFVAWINFWMDPKELSTRSTLAISAFLAMCLQLGNVQQNQPRVSYVKAMDIWMLGSISFLFLALVELAIISFIVRTDKIDQPEKKKRFIYPYIPPSPSNYFEFYEHPRVTLAHRIQRRSMRDPIYHELITRNINTRPCHEHCPMRNLDKSTDVDEHSRSQFGQPTSSAQCWHDEKRDEPAKANPRLSAYAVDKFFLILYPPAFLLFNIIYWSYYL